MIATGFGANARRRGRRAAYDAPMPAGTAAGGTVFEPSDEALDVPSFLRDE